MMRYPSVFAGVFAGIVFLVAMPVLLFAEPVAPMLKLNEGGLEIMKAQGKSPADMKKAVPSKASVGLPVYPGAFFASSTEGGKSGSVRMLPAVNLVSTDAPKVIKTWYAKHLAQDWTYDRRFDLFHKGKGKVGMGDLMSMPTITVLAEDEPGFDLMFFDTRGIKSRIIIRYTPKP